VLSKIFGTIFFLSLLGIILVIFQGGATSTGQVIFSQDYRTPGSSQVISFNDPATLKVFQSNLQANRPDYYAFQGAKDSIITIKLDTLRLAGQDNFSPSLALFGPGLPPLTPDEQQLFPFSLPAGYGLLLSAESTPISQTTQPTEQPTRFDEPWTQSGYWERQSILNQLLEDGTYYLAVYNLHGQGGKYALFVGDKPEAGLRETLTFPVTWVRLHYWFEDLWWPTFALVVVGLLVVALLYLWGRNLGKSFSQPAPAVYPAPDEPAPSPVPAADPLPEMKTAPSADESTHHQPKTTDLPVVTQTPLLNWEEPEKAATSLVQVAPSPAPDLASPELKNGPVREDGLTEWGKRFRP